MAMSKKEFIQAFVIQQAGVLTGDVAARAATVWESIESMFRPEGPSFDVTKVEKAEWEEDSFGDDAEARKLVLGSIELSIDKDEKRWRCGIYTSADTDHIFSMSGAMKAKNQEEAKIEAIAWFKRTVEEWVAKLPE